MKIKTSLIVICSLILVGLLPSQAARTNYQSLNFVSGVNPELDLQIHEKSLNLDLAKTANLRLRVRVEDLYTTNDSTANFKVIVYDLIGGVKSFSSSQSLSIQRGANRYRILSVNAGHFPTTSKDVLFELYDTQNNLINIYSATLNATNINTQTSSGSGIDLNASCPGTAFGECQIDAFFNRVNFVVRRQKQASTRVTKDENGIYQVVVPVPRKGFSFLRGNRFRAINIGQGSGNGSTVEIPEFVDTLGVGVTSKTAVLEVAAGNTLVPSLIINPGPLTTAIPNNGAIEFDGTNLYLTKGGVRSVLGATGPAGAPGSTGPAGTFSGTFVGNTTFTGNANFSGTVTASQFVGPTPFSVASSVFDINGLTNIDVTGLNYIRVSDSNTATTDEIFTLTGGITGQKVILRLQNDINFRANNIGTLNTIQWGRGTPANSTRLGFTTEALEFFYDGNAWYLLDRYNL